MLKADDAHHRRIGIALVTVATLCFSILDASAKWLVQDLPVMQVVWLRFATHVVLMVLLLAPQHGRALVRMEISNRVVEQEPEEQAMNLETLVERGMRIRLTPQGITGTSFLELDYVDPPPPMLPIAWTPNNVYIPSTPSTVSQLVNAAADIIDYKSDGVSASKPETLVERVEHYRPQIDAYRDAVATMTGLPAERVTARLLFVNEGVVRAV